MSDRNEFEPLPPHWTERAIFAIVTIVALSGIFYLWTRGMLSLSGLLRWPLNAPPQ